MQGLSLLILITHEPRGLGFRGLGFRVKTEFRAQKP